MSGEAADHASTSRAPGPDIEAEADMGRTPDTPPTEDADKLSATNSEVESAMNHRRHRTVLRDACFSPEAFDAFNSGDAYLRVAQNGLARATDQYVRDVRVSKSDDYMYQYPLRLEIVGTTDLRIIYCASSYREEYSTITGAGGMQDPTTGRCCCIDGT